VSRINSAYSMGFSRDDTSLLHFVTFVLPISSYLKSSSPLPHPLPPPSPRFRSSRARVGSGIARTVEPRATTLADGDGGVQQQPGTEPRRWMNRAAVCRVAHTYISHARDRCIKRERARTKARVEATDGWRELA